MVLNHVAKATRTFIIRTATVHAELFGQRDLNARHEIAIPDGLEKGVRKTKVKDIHDRLLPQIVIDPEDGVLGKYRACHRIELARRGEITPEWLLHDDAGIFRQPRTTETQNYRFKKRRGNGEVVRGTMRLPERALERLECLGIVVVARYILQQGKQNPQRARTHDGARVPDALRDPFPQRRDAHGRARHADDGHGKDTALDHRVERGKDLLVGEVTRHAEEHQRIRRSRTVHFVHLELPLVIGRHHSERVASGAPDASAASTIPCASARILFS